MKTLKTKITSEGQIVGKPKYRQFETIQEVMDLHDEAKILEMINAQEKGNCIKEARATYKIAKKILLPIFATISDEDFAELKQKMKQTEDTGDETIVANAIYDLHQKYNL